MNKKHIFLTALALCGVTALVQAKDKHKSGTYSYTPGTRYYTGTTTPVTQPRPTGSSGLSSAKGSSASKKTTGTCTYKKGKKNRTTTKKMTRSKCSKKGGTWTPRS